MTVVTLNRKEVEQKLGKITPEIEEKISMFGTPVESMTEDEIVIEVFPNRPDLLSFSGFTRAMEYYLKGEKLKEYKIEKSNAKIMVDKSVAKIRPYSMAAIVRGIKFTDEKIKEIMQWQEKIHLTMGRNRKKVAIGYYCLDKIKFPVTYLAKSPKEIVFEPLDLPEKMNAIKIMQRHPCGRDYGEQLKNFDKYPVYYDSNNEVLSMPPIINSNNSGKITPGTTDILVECSGNNSEILKKAIIMATCDLIDLGGKAYSVEIDYGQKKEIISLEQEKLKFKIEDINKTLGLELKEKDIQKLLEKMGIGYENSKGESFALIPAYRTDMLHWIDLAEEIGIAYGYENFQSEIPKISTIAEEDKKSVLKKIICDVLSGLGLMECSSFHLTTKDDIKKMYFDFKSFIEVEESKTEYNVLRIDLLNNLMKVFSENSDSNYPQKVFEMGKIFALDKNAETGIDEKERLSVAIAGDDANFTEIKRILDYLFKMLDKNYTLELCDDSNYILGRIGKIFIEKKNPEESNKIRGMMKDAVNLAKSATGLTHLTNKISDKEEIGVIGEISPRVLNNFKLKMPVAAFEINLDKLFG